MMPYNATGMLAMMTVGANPVIDGASTTGTFTGTFNSDLSVGGVRTQYDDHVLIRSLDGSAVGV